MPLGKSDEFCGALATSNCQDADGTASVENGIVETESKGKGCKNLQTAFNGDEPCEKGLKLSPDQLMRGASTTSSLPRNPPLPTLSPSSGQGSIQAVRKWESHSKLSSGENRRASAATENPGPEAQLGNGIVIPSTNINVAEHQSLSSGTKIFDHKSKPNIKSRAVSTPGSNPPNADRNATDTSLNQVFSRPAQLPNQLNLDPPPFYSLEGGIDTKPPKEECCASPMPSSMPLPPFSLPTYLHLELSSNSPSSLYIHRSKTSEIPYEPSRVKIERLLNFLLLPPHFEQVLLFGTLACLDAFLYSFTILPLRFFKALSILAQSLGRNMAEESQYIAAFIYTGAVRVWKRKRRDSMKSNNDRFSKTDSLHRLIGESVPTASQSSSIDGKNRSACNLRREPLPVQSQTSGGARPTFQSASSHLLLEQKVDLLKGFLLILSCTILMYFDASRMYHGIRGQAAIKLYVIYNVLEVSCKA